MPRSGPLLKKEKTPHEFAFQIAASCDLKGLDTPQNSP